MTTNPPLPIRESYWVVPGQFLAGEYPGHWHAVQTRKRLDSFLEMGINTFIDLTHPGELQPYQLILEVQAGLYGLEAAHKRFMIGDMDVPEPKLMRSILDTIDEALASGNRVYTHCWGGIGRTGTTVGCFLVRHGMTGQQALDQLAKWWQEVPKHTLYPRSPQTDRQVEFVRSWTEARG